MLLRFLRSQKFLWIIFGLFIIGLVVGMIFYFKSSSDTQISFTPQQRQLFLLDGTNKGPLDILATTLPQFALQLADEKFSNIWQAHAAGKEDLVDSTVSNKKGDITLPVQTQFNATKKQVILTPDMQNKVKPGMYRLNITVKTIHGENITITQDFRWGVLAINTNKAVYQSGEEVKIGMAVLDDLGRTKCIAQNGQVQLSTAKIWLTIQKPSGTTQTLSTDEGSIIGAKSCADRTFTYDPDFLGKITVQETGKYMIHMEAETILGKASIDDFFTVASEQPFTIERTQYPTRIYPRFSYPISIIVNANQDYTGTIYDIVPESFTISDISDGGKVVTHGDFQTIEWNKQLAKGQSYSFSYIIKFPPVTPEFYLIGPLHIGEFSESREWQVASDSLFQLVQEVHAVGNAASPFSATFGSGVQLNHLLVMNCMRSANNSFSTTSPWSRAFSETTAPRIYQYYRVVTALYVGTSTFSCTSTSAPTTGEMAIDLMEFSGNSASSVFDKAATARGSRTCNTSSNTTNTLAPLGSDELMVSASAANANALTVTSHTTIGGSSLGFTDSDLNDTGPGGNNNGFYRTSGTGSYDSAYGEDIGSGTISDQILFSGSGTCSNGMGAYKPPLTITQGSFRFFDNANSINPSTSFNNGATAANAAITLNQPNQKFRLRMLLDINSNVGNLLQSTGDFVLMYATISGTLTCSTASYDLVSTPTSKSDIAFNSNPAVGISGGGISSTASDPSDSPTYTTVLQSYYEDDSTSAGPTGGGAPGDVSNDIADIANLQSGEWDFSLIDNTDDSKTSTYCLELQNGGGSPLDSYAHIPQVTTLNNDVVIRGSPGGTIIKGSPGTNGTRIQ